MGLSFERKQAIVAATHEEMTGAVSTVVADYTGMTVLEFTAMRKQARERGVKLQVIRNSLAQRAFEGTDFACLSDTLTGPTLLGFSQDDPGASARLFRDFRRGCPALKVKAVAVGSSRYEAEDLGKVATLPTKDEAIAMLMSVMKAPVTKLTQTMNAVPLKLVRTMVALKEQKVEAE